MSLAFGSNADLYAPLQLHLLAGGTMLGAFFIATDPVSAATSHQGKLIYGAGIGVLVYLIRTWGNYPDAIAFSVLLMNFAVPFIDHYTPPRRSEEHTSELQSRPHLVCRLLLEKKKINTIQSTIKINIINF